MNASASHNPWRLTVAPMLDGVNGKKVLFGQRLSDSVEAM